MVSKTFSFCGNGFFGCHNDHIKIEIQAVLAICHVSLERRSEKTLNRSGDPVKEVILAGEVETVSWMEVKLKKFLACKFDSWLYIPHM